MGGQFPNDVGALAPDGLIAAVFQGSEVATLQHALIAALVAAAFILLAVKRKIIQLPHAGISGPLAAFMVLILASVFMSDYRWVSQTSLAEWMIYGLAVIACVGGLGRKSGPVIVLSALAAGSSVVALMGVLEYGSMRNEDATWRIFSTWNNPNALAGMMVIGAIVGLGLLANAKTLLPLILGGLAGTFCTLALILTGSKGGIIALGIGLFVLAVLLIAWKRSLAVATAAAFLALAFLPVVVMQKSGSGGAGSRVMAAGATQDQSAGFRVQLWKGAIELVKRNPVGEGFGTYAFHSAKPGTNTRTELTHSTWLQLAVEAGPLAPIALILMLLGWMVHTFRSARSLPTDQNVLRAAVIAAVAGTAAHGFVDSNLYFFGIGLAFFLLLGVGIQLSADAGAPEFVAPSIRVAAAVFTLACVAQLFFAGMIAKAQSNVRWYLHNQEPQEAVAGLESLRGIAPFDGETWYRSGYVATSAEQALGYFARAAEVAPSPRYYRRLAFVQMETGRLPEAEATLRRALRMDPNNLSALRLLIDVQEKLGAEEQARQTANRMIAIEATPYFKIRSLPEVIPTETYEARIYLADKGGNVVQLLRPAVDGLVRFATTTLPYSRRMARAGIGVNPSVAEAEENVEMGMKAAQKLRAAYLAAGDSDGVKWSDEALAALESSLGGSK